MSERKYVDTVEELRKVAIGDLGPTASRCVSATLARSLSPTAAARMAGRRAATSGSVVLNNPFNFANDPELAQAWAIGYEEESKC